MDKNPPIIGIDLGTTNSLVAMMKNKRVVVIPNKYEEQLTPSVVAEADDGKILVGREAKSILALKPHQAASLFKRQMGNDQPIAFGSKKLTPTELSSLVLASLKEDAERYIEEKIERAVITVPAYFSEQQRQDTKKAAELAGLKVARILNEPTAAAMSFGVNNRDQDCKFIVFDLGGGTFDVCVMELFDETLQVLSTAGIQNLGGEDFTMALMDHVLKKYGRGGQEEFRKSNSEDWGLLLKRCEIAKKLVAKRPMVEIELPDSVEKGENSSLEITAELAEEIFAPILERLVAPVREAVRGAKSKREEMDFIIMAGGASRMSVVHRMVEKIFGKKVVSGMHPDLAIVQGAAIQAALCEENASVEDIVVTDVLSHSLGVDITQDYNEEAVHGIFSPVIHRNTVIPTSRTEYYATRDPRQKSGSFEVFEGESRFCRDNKKLGEILVEDLPQTGKVHDFACTFTYDINGLLEVFVRGTNSDIEINKIFSRAQHTLSEEDMERAKERLKSLRHDSNYHPIEQATLRRADLLLRELTGQNRQKLEIQMDRLQLALNSKDAERIAGEKDALQALCEQFEEDETW